MSNCLIIMAQYIKADWANAQDMKAVKKKKKESGVVTFALGVRGYFTKEVTLL